MQASHSTPRNYDPSLSPSRPPERGSRRRRSPAAHHAACSLLCGDQREQLLCLARSRLPALPAAFSERHKEPLPRQPQLPRRFPLRPPAIAAQEPSDRLGAGGAQQAARRGRDTGSASERSARRREARSRSPEYRPSASLTPPGGTEKGYPQQNKSGAR